MALPAPMRSVAAVVLIPLGHAALLAPAAVPTRTDTATRPGLHEHLGDRTSVSCGPSGPVVARVDSHATRTCVPALPALTALAGEPGGAVSAVSAPSTDAAPGILGLLDLGGPLCPCRCPCPCACPAADHTPVRSAASPAPATSPAPSPPGRRPAAATHRPPAYSTPSAASVASGPQQTPVPGQAPPPAAPPRTAPPPTAPPPPPAVGAGQPAAPEVSGKARPSDQDQWDLLLLVLVVVFVPTLLAARPWRRATPP